MNFSNFFIDMLNGSNSAASMDSKKSPSPAFLFSDIMKVCEDESVNPSSPNNTVYAGSSKEIFSAADSVISVSPQELNALSRLVSSIINESGNVQPTSTNYNLDQTKISKQQFILSENKLVDLLSDLITQSNYPLSPFINQLQSSESNKPITISFKSGSDKLTISFNPIKVDENYTNSIINDEYGFVNKLIVKEGLFDKNKVKASSLEEVADSKTSSDDDSTSSENMNLALPSQIFFRTEILKIENSNLAGDGSSAVIQALSDDSTISTFLAYKNFVASNKTSGEYNTTQTSINKVASVASSVTENQNVAGATVNKTVGAKADATSAVYTSTVSESSKDAASSEQSKLNSSSENAANTSSKEIIFTTGNGNGKNVSIASLMEGLSEEEKSVFKNMTASGELKKIIYSKESSSYANITTTDIKNSPTLDANEPITSQVNNSVAVNKQSAANNQMIASTDLKQVISTVSTEESSSDPKTNAQGKQNLTTNVAVDSSINGNKVFTLSTDKPTVSLSDDQNTSAETKTALDTASIENSKVVVKINAKVSGKIDVKVESGNVSSANAAKELLVNTKIDTVIKNEVSTITQNADATENMINETAVAQKEIALSSTNAKLTNQSKSEPNNEIVVNSTTVNQSEPTDEKKKVVVADNVMSKEIKSSDITSDLNVKKEAKEAVAASTKNVELPQENINSAQKETTPPALEIKAKTAEQKNITVETKVAETKNITQDDNVADNEIKLADADRTHAKMPAAKEEKIANAKNEITSDKEINLNQKENVAQEKNTVQPKTDLTTEKIANAVQQENVSKILAKDDKSSTTKDGVEAKETVSQDSKEVKRVDQDSQPNLNSDDDAKRNAHESFKNTLAQTVSNDGEIGKTKVVSEPIRVIKQNEIIPEFTKLIQQNEKQTMTFQVTPENLGKVKLIVDLVNNQIQTRIEVENEQVKQFIQSNVDQLKQNLQTSGIQLGDLNISLTDYSQKNTGKVFNPKKKSLFNQDKEIKAEEIADQPLKKMGYNTYEYLA